MININHYLVKYEEEKDICHEHITLKNTPGGTMLFFIYVDLDQVLGFKFFSFNIWGC